MREEHGFRIGVAEVEDSLRAVERIGIRSERGFRTALRAVLCGRHSERETFDRVFDAFFLQRRFVVRAVEERLVDAGIARAEAVVRSPAADWEALIAKYSPAAGRSRPPALEREGAQAYRRAAEALIARVHLGRSRKWRPQHDGVRFDLRRTLRASLHTGGDPVRLRRLGHPHRNPRFALLIDGSRSMSQHAPSILQFARALVRRTRRASVFVFSTELREVTRALRRSHLPDLGEAWGGGTRIGAALRTFVHRHRGILGDDTIGFVFSDGLDFGDTKSLRDAADQLHRRCAALVWISPDANVPGYTPATRGMQAVLPFITALLGTSDLRDLNRALGRRLLQKGL